jgi:hypothetical protein
MLYFMTDHRFYQIQNKNTGPEAFDARNVQAAPSIVRQRLRPELHAPTIKHTIR